MSNEIILEARNLKKTFGPTLALDNVSFTLRRGDVRGLIGENGSGKSTLTSILCGVLKADSGQISYKGKTFNPHSIVDAQNHGITMILQEAGTIADISVAQNIFLGSERDFCKLGFMNQEAMFKAADDLLDELGLTHIRGRDNISIHSFEERKLVEIVRAIRKKPEILVVDETTTALSHDGRNLLYQLIEDMSNQDKSVIFISHDLDEVLDKCTVLSVLRDGQEVGELGKHEMVPSVVRNMMVGREISDKYYREDYDRSCQEEVALSFEQVSMGRIKDFNLEVHKGEIVGIGGLSGDGMHEIGKLAFGIQTSESGKVTCGGREIQSPKEAIELGLGYISKDRDREALILNGSIQDNIVMPSLSSIVKGTFVNPLKEKKMASEMIEQLSIKCRNQNQDVRELSGGNKQKVSFGKWIAKGSDVIVMDCPTRGVDIGVKQAMYELITEMKKEGKAILFISEELTELIGMCDRIQIMKDFKVSKEFQRHPELRDRDIIEYMI